MELYHSGTFYKGVTKDLKGPHYPGEPYEVGSVHEVELDISSASCAPGIHVCWTIAEALMWGPRVVRLQLASDGQVVANGKVRVGPRVTVQEIDVQIGAYLARANLTGANLTRANLGGADLTGANLTGANLARANLTGADLTGADLRGAYLAHANLTGAYLGGANLRDADLAGADLRGADLRADLRDADLTGAYLRGASGMPWSGMPGGWRLDNAGSWTRSR